MFFLSKSQTHGAALHREEPGMPQPALLERHLIDSSCSSDAHFRNSHDCFKYVSKEACLEQQKEITWLSSYPGSGNTWTRLLLEQTTGVYTGGVYNDESLMDLGMAGEGVKDPARVLTVKIHLYPWEKKPTHGRAIVIFRSPLDAILSHTNIYLATRRGANMHAAEMPPELVRASFVQHREERLERWRDFVKFWLGFQGDKLLLRYEDMVADAEGAMKKQLLPFLGIDPDKVSKRLRCALNNQMTQVQRNHTYAFNFTDEDYAAVREGLGDLPAFVGYTL